MNHIQHTDKTCNVHRDLHLFFPINLKTCYDVFFPAIQIYIYHWHYITKMHYRMPSVGTKYLSSKSTTFGVISSFPTMSLVNYIAQSSEMYL